MARIMVTGGSSSGKSEWAEKLALNLSCETDTKVIYVATGVACDQEFADRIRCHQERRPAGWGLVETPCDLARVLTEYGRDHEILLIDGLGTWLTNIMMADSEGSGFEKGSIELDAKLDELVESYNNCTGFCIVVADEVGMGIVPDNQFSRRFRDLNGRMNQMLARVSDEVYLVSCGLPVRLK